MLSSRLLISLILVAYYCSTAKGSEYCHYTCLNCTSQSYTSCIACSEGQLSYWPMNSQERTGLCTDPISSNFNILGVVMVFTLVMFCCFIRNEFIFYVFFYFQTCGALYFVEVSWAALLNYILLAFTYLMPVATISSRIRRQKEAIGSYYKQGQYFKSINFYAIVAFLGSINAFLMVLMIVIPLFKSCRSRFINDRSSVITDGTLETLLRIIKISFLILIQQTCLTLFYCLYNSQTPQKASQIVIVSIYFIFLIFFVIYHCFEILPIFRTKMSQFLMMTSRIIIPVFILLDKKYHFLCPILAIFFFFWEMISNSKNKQNRKLNRRLLCYKSGGIIILGIFQILYFLEIRLNIEEISKIIGIILFTITVIGIDVIYIEAFVQAKTQCCEKYLSVEITSKLSFDCSQQIDPRKVHHSSEAVILNKVPLNLNHQTEQMIDFSQIVNITFEDVPQICPRTAYRDTSQSLVSTKRAKTTKYHPQPQQQPQKLDQNEEQIEQLKDQTDQTFIFPFKQLIQDQASQ